MDLNLTTKEIAECSASVGGVASRSGDATERYDGLPFFKEAV